MSNLISKDFIKSLGGECIAARDSKTHELLPISSIDALPSAEPEEVYCPMASRACFANGKEIAWCLTCPHISEEDRELVKKAVEGSQPKTGKCETCRRNADNGGIYQDGRTRCPIQEHYVLLKDGYCHLYELRMRGEEE